MFVIVCKPVSLAALEQKWIEERNISVIAEPFCSRTLINPVCVCVCVWLESAHLRPAGTTAGCGNGCLSVLNFLLIFDVLTATSYRTTVSNDSNYSI